MNAKPKKKVVTFLPFMNQGSICTQFVESYLRAKDYLMAKVDELPFDVEYLEYSVKTFPVHEGRNECAHRFVEGIPMSGTRIFRADVSIWLDMDHQIPQDTLFKMLEHERPIILGVYYIKVKSKESPFYPVLFMKRHDGSNLYKAVMEFPEKDLFEVDFAGMGAACIYREVFEKLDPPYFDYMKHPENLLAGDSEWKHEKNIKDISEDRWFWEQVKEKTDYPILVDPTIQFGHVTTMVIDQYMFKAWLNTYKERLLKEHGQEKYDKEWGKIAAAQPYREVKVHGKAKGSKRKQGLSKVG